MSTRRSFVVITGMILTILMSLPASGQNKNPVLAPVKDEANLPRVLLLGDSISMGYTLPVREMLKGKANVHRPAENCGPTTRGVASIDKWLGEGKWDVIHFNFGLHDIKYMNEKAVLVDVKEGKQQVSPEDYEKNLRTIVEKLKKTGAKLIWCATTPVPVGAKGRIVGDEVKYNAIAAKIMKEQGVAINDLHSYAKERQEKIQRPKDVHFTPEGSKVLAQEVVKHLSKALP